MGNARNKIIVSLERNLQTEVYLGVSFTRSNLTSAELRAVQQKPITASARNDFSFDDNMILDCSLQTDITTFDLRSIFWSLSHTLEWNVIIVSGEEVRMVSYSRWCPRDVLGGKGTCPLMHWWIRRASTLREIFWCSVQLGMLSQVYQILMDNGVTVHGRLVIRSRDTLLCEFKRLT